MGNILKEYLSFTSKERNGLIVVIALMFIVLIFLNIDFHPESNNDTDMAIFAEELSALSEASKNKARKKPNNFTNRTVSDKVKEESEPYIFHDFDPNQVEEEEWKKMGLQSWQIKGINKYREKAGDIKTPEQFSELHVISDEFFNKVEQYLVFEVKNAEKLTAREEEGNNDKLKEEVEPMLSVELNIASATRLTKVKGIGPAFSKRIVKYRNMLGGFISMEQLLEVYGLEDSLYGAIKPFLTLNTKGITRIDINSVMIDELRKHPYIKWNIANGIVNYRDQHGAFKTVSDIKKTDLVSEELYVKISPYLSVE